ncbi:hypothetical protein BDL97_03G084500 [Sphagnum fallax]|nr:hypothetical protein BDL97_03G084500 [Sphagnum fallax]
MFSFKFHSFIHLGAFVGGVVACLDALLVSASHRSLGVVCVCVCVCVRAKITWDCVLESEDQSRFASMQSHEFRHDPNPGIKPR